MAEVIRYVDPDAVGGGTGLDWTNAYTSLSAMEAAEQDDFDTANNWLHCYCRSSSGTDDTTPVVINGSVTSATDYIKIEATSGHRAKKTGLDDSIYHLNVTGYGFQVWDNHVWGDGLQITSSNVGFEVSNVAAGSWCRISNCRQFGAGYLCYLTDADGDVQMWNSICDGGNRLYRQSGGNADIENCIAYGSAGNGIDIDGGTVTITNCCAFNNGATDIDGGTIDYCASDDGGGTNEVAESGGGAAWPNDFTDAANGDFTLKGTSNLVGAGVADGLGGLYTTDIEGDTYASPPSLGVDEIAASGAVWIPRVIMF